MEQPDNDRFVTTVGVLMFVLEIWKQITIWKVECAGKYDVWYVPFQLCSMPMYLLLLYGFIRSTDSSFAVIKKSILTFIEDFGLLGGIMALIVHDGLVHEGYPLLTLHGFLWHILMVILSLYIFMKDLSYRGTVSFFRTVPIFALTAAMAFMINVLLHRYGDCDMFYISPYHNSSQMVYHEIDEVIGRPAGIFLYLSSIVAGAFLVHKVFDIAYAYRAGRK